MPENMRYARYWRPRRIILYMVTPSVKRNSETLTRSVTILRMKIIYHRSIVDKNSEPENAACLPHRLRRF